MSNKINTTKKYIKELLSLNSLPCKESVQWYQQVGITDKYELVDAAKPEWQRWVANYTSNTKILSRLAKSVYNDVRFQVAINGNTPVKVLKMLAMDVETSVREGAAYNPNTPAEMLEILANDPSANVKMRVAYNPNTPAETLETLANDGNEDIRQLVIGLQWLKTIIHQQ